MKKNKENNQKLDKLTKDLESLEEIKQEKRFDRRGKNIELPKIREIGIAIATTLKKINQDHFLLSGDSRISTPLILETLKETLEEDQITVINIGTNNTTPVFEIAQREYQLSGVNITASHQAKEYNGLKITFSKDPNLDKLEQLKSNSKLKSNQPQTFQVRKQLKQLYLEQLLEKFQHFSFQGEILYDAMHGSSYEFFKKAAKRLNLKHTPYRETPNGNFPSTPNGPDPSNKDNFLQLLKENNISQYDLVAMVDGDGDRFGCATKKGYITPQELTALRAITIKNENFVAEYPLASIIQDHLLSKGITTISSKRGRVNLIENCQQYNCPGAELGLHNYDETGLDDGIQNTFELLLGDNIESMLKTISPRLRAFYPEIRVKTNKDSKQIVQETYQKFYLNHPKIIRNQNGELIDGIAIHDREYGVFIRGSSNENSLTVNVNSLYNSVLESIFIDISNQLEEVENGLALKLTNRLKEVQKI